MLTIITGGAMSKKDKLLRDEMVNAKRNGRQVLVIVPDQFSFEDDKILYDELGAEFYNSLTIFGINRLCEEIIKRYGSSNGEIADEYSKTIAMYNALRKVRSEGSISFFKKNVEKPYFTKEMISLISDLRKNSISAPEIEKVAFASDGVLGQKLSDIAKIYAEFDDTLAKRGLCDSLSLIHEAAKLIIKHRTFSDYDIFIDRFDSFSADEYSLISALLSVSGNMSVALTLSDENNSRSYLSPFSETVKTYSRLLDIAKTLSIKCERKYSRQYYYNKQSLVYVNANIYCLENKKIENYDGVEVVKAQDMYDEIEYVAAEIKRLVANEGYAYSDIAVISRQLEEYIPILESSFERYEIPSFFDTKKSTTGNVLSIYIRMIADLAKSNSFKTEKILSMIKSPLSPFKDFETNALEEYCYSWGVEGNMWSKPFAASKNVLNINTLEEIRQKIVNPILKFRKSVEVKTAENLIDSFVNLLKDYDINKCINSVVKRSLSVEQENSFITEKSASIELTREFKKVWDMFRESLFSMRKNLAGSELSLKEFSDILGLLMSSMEISNPPQRINTVTVASASHTRLGAVKAVFVIGANDNKFPAPPEKGGVFSEKEKRVLQNNGIDFAESALSSLQKERLTVYLALTQGSDRLYVTYSLADIKGSPMLHSEIVTYLVGIFGTNVVKDISALDVDFYCRTPRSAASKLSEVLNDNTTSSETLKSALLQFDRTKKYANRIINRAKQSPYALDPKVSKKLFFSENEKDSLPSIYLSYTNLNTYNDCPFEYFCKYGLRLYVPQKFDLNNMNIGSLIHYIMEKLLSCEKDGEISYNSEIETLSFEEIKEKCTKLALDYKERELGGDYGKSRVFEKNFERIVDNAAYIVQKIIDEVINSKFKPCYFEYKINSSKIKDKYSVLGDDFIVKFNGVIDRIDTYENDDGLYIKIVDYKTGKTTFSLSDINNSKNMQLLLYMQALIHESKETFGVKSKAKPAAALYSPAKYVTSTTTTDGKKDINIYVDTVCTNNGILVDDEEIKSALNAPGRKEVKRVSEERFDQVLNFVEDRVKKIASSLSDGNIEASPLCKLESKSFKKPCSFCDFSDVCGVKNKKPKRIYIDNNNDEQLDFNCDKESDDELKEGKNNG